MLVKISELTGTKLDWAVAKCEGFTLYEDAMLNGITKRGVWLSGLSIEPNTWTPLAMFTPSTDWAQGGPIIEREKFDRISTNVSGGFTVSRKFVELRDDDSYSIRWVHGSGPTTLIATMRCYVASKLGDTVEIPDELMV